MTTSNKKSKRQSIIAILLIAAIAVTGAFAFLTATTETKVNKFTVGSISVDLDEGPWDDLVDTDGDNIPDEAENLVSGKIVEKAPSIVNGGSAPAYGFIVLEVPKAEFVATDATGKKLPTAVNELFTLHTMVSETEMVDGINTANWELVETNTTASDEVNYYVYSYNGIIDAAGQTETLFDKVKFAYITEDFAGDTNMNVTITATAVAIQADEENITSVEAAWNALSTDSDFIATNIYPIA